MLNYLLKYDIDVTEEVEESFEYIPELDITDKTLLQEQINQLRKSQYNLLKLYDELQDQKMTVENDLSNLNRKVWEENPNRNDRTNELSSNEDIAVAKLKVEAIAEAQKTILNQVNMIKADLKIMTSSMYSKF